MHFLVAFQLQAQVLPTGRCSWNSAGTNKCESPTRVNENDPIVWISCGFAPAFHPHGQVLELPCAFWVRPVFSRRTLDRPSSRQPLWMISCPWCLGFIRSCRETPKERCVFLINTQWVGHVDVKHVMVRLRFCSTSSFPLVESGILRMLLWRLCQHR